QLTKDNIDYFSTIEQQLHHISVHDIDEIRDELAEQGFMKQRKNQTKKKKAQIQLQHYISTDGDDIYIGKNNKQNDYLTNKKAK
ncbi:NFACT family protein, partial [Vibrio cholerae O1]|nr:NFACT family protein [Vibrio cholerae O1]